MSNTPPDVLKSEFLLELQLHVDEPAVAVAPMPAGERLIYPVRGGTFEGPLGRGIVLPGGADWALRGADELFRIDVRAMLQMEDGAMLSVTYQGLLDLRSGYWRTLPVFDTTAEKYRWLTRVICVGIGEKVESGVNYRIYVIR